MDSAGWIGGCVPVDLAGLGLTGGRADRWCANNVAGTRPLARARLVEGAIINVCARVFLPKVMCSGQPGSAKGGTTTHVVTSAVTKRAMLLGWACSRQGTRWASQHTHV